MQPGSLGQGVETVTAIGGEIQNTGFRESLDRLIWAGNSIRNWRLMAIFGGLAALSGVGILILHGVFTAPLFIGQFAKWAAGGLGFTAKFAAVDYGLVAADELVVNNILDNGRHRPL